MSVAVITDPSAVMPRAWLAELPLSVVPLEIAWPDGSRDPGDLPYAAIAERLAASPTPPTTGAPAPGLYAELIGRALQDHDGVLVVCPSAELSTTFQSAMIGAREVSDERVRVLDSKTAAAGQGLVAAEAALASVRGAAIDDVCTRAVDVAGKIQIWATLARLDMLRRSGRVPAVAAMGAGALGLQPVVRYAGASPAPVGVVRSTTRGADRLFRAWERSIGPGPCRAVIFHAARDHDAARLRDSIGRRTPEAAVEVVEVTASLASHTGPGLLGLAWFWDN